jgi:hypothetical protein
MNFVLKFSPAVVYNTNKINIVYERYFDDITNDIINQPNFGWLNCWSKNLKNDGFFCKEIISDEFALQKLWAVENNLQIDNNKSREEILLEIAISQIKIFNPTFVFIHDYFFFDTCKVLKLRKIFPDIRFISWDGYLAHNTDYYQNFDLVLCPVQTSVNFYKSNGINSWLFNFGVDEDVLNSIDINKKVYYSAFCGSTNLKRYKNRVDYISFLLNSGIELNVYTPDYSNSLYRKLRSYVKRLINYNYNPVDDLIISNKGGIWGREYMEKIQKSWIGLNIHGEKVVQEAGNIRLMEIPSAGTLLFTDFKPNLKSLFVDGTYISFDNKYDCHTKFKYLRENPALISDTIARMTEHLWASHLYRYRFDSLKDELIQIL